MGTIRVRRKTKIVNPNAARWVILTGSIGEFGIKEDCTKTRWLIDAETAEMVSFSLSWERDKQFIAFPRLVIT